MSEKDVTSIDFLEDNEHFADLLNTYCFYGRQVISPNDIRELNRSNSIPRNGANANKSIVVMKDIVRTVAFQMKAAIIAIEEQSDIHYAMPIRVMIGESANYHSQWRKLQRQHKTANDLRGNEFLSGFAKTERLIPISTLVLYFGQKPWDGPRCLKDILDLAELPNEMKDMIADYPIHILEVRRFTNYELFQTDWKWIFGFLQRDTDKHLLATYVSDNQTIFENLAEDTYDMIRQFSHVKKLENTKITYKNEKGEINMCKAIDDMIADSRAEGMIEGSACTIIKMCKEYGESLESTTKRILREFPLSEEQLQNYLNRYWF